MICIYIYQGFYRPDILRLGSQLRCAYEAYLAQEEGKTILIAHSSNLQQICGALCWMLVAAIVGGATGIAIRFLEVKMEYRTGEKQGMPGYVSVLFCLGILVNGNVLRRVIHLLGVALVAFHYAAGLTDFWSFPKLAKVPYAVGLICHWLVFLSSLLEYPLLFCIMEVDRINGIIAKSEAEELQQGYQGKVLFCVGVADDWGFTVKT